jgi:hypothetical protein
MKTRLYALTLLATAVISHAESVQVIADFGTDITSIAQGSLGSAPDWRDDGNQITGNLTRINPLGEGSTFTLETKTAAAIATEASIVASDEKITGFTFNNWRFNLSLFGSSGFGNGSAGSTGEITTFFQATLSTAGGDYIFTTTDTIDAGSIFGSDKATVTANHIDALDANGTWGVLGDINSVDVRLSDITGITYSAIAGVIVIDPTQVGNSFYIIESLGGTIETTTVPEPSTYAMLSGLLALGYVMVKRRTHGAY